MDRIHVFKTDYIACEYVADKIQKCIKEKRRKGEMCVLGLATGSTPIYVYKILVEWYKKGLLSFKDVITFNLDEYYGIPRECKESYYTYMHDNFFDHIDILKENINLLNSEIPSASIDEECKKYEQKIQEVGGIDIQLLGIGQNGHIAFNEPLSSFDSVTRLVALDKQTIESNKVYFYDENPTHALTMGIKTIMDAKCIYLLGWKDKGKIINICMKGVDNKYPASVLLEHQSVMFILDESASSYIEDHLKN